VVDGPFAGFHGKYFDDVVNNPKDKLVPHCLSRGFRDGDTFSGHKFRPEAMSKMFRQTSFDKFFLYLDLGPHNGIPQGIRGDFATFTAPYGKLKFSKRAGEGYHSSSSIIPRSIDSGGCGSKLISRAA
jgi:tyrosinase